MHIGTSYYPEHWPRERWAVDAKLMQEAGFNVVRMSEFAWVFMEPEEACFDFSLFDDALKVFADHGISVVLSTPTAVMPAWVAHKYPDCLAIKADGTQKVWGVRKNNSFSSETYRMLSERITRAMAEHFKDVPNVIGWQTDNEFDGHPDFSPTTRAAFQDWLRKKYGTLDALNEAWGTRFWGQLYHQWGEIVMPDDLATHNPGLCLDWRRYHSALQVEFQSHQVRILREVCPHHFVTHNIMAFHPLMDFYDLCRDLDFASWDNYPVYGPPAVLYNAAAGADVVRGYKQGKNFWVMEQTAGPGGWGFFGRNPRPGEIRMMSWEQIAHGADAILWFNWRTCTVGREQYYHGLLGHDGRALRRYREAAQFARELQSVSDQIVGTTVQSDVAIIYNFDTVWATEIQPSFKNNSWFQNALQRFHSPLMRAGVNADVIDINADFSKYKMIVAPELYVLPDSVAKRLEQFVQDGGVLVADVRTGVKDEHNRCHERTLPGLLSGVFGIEIEEYEGMDGMGDLPAEEYSVKGSDTLSGEFHALYYTDWLQTKGAKALAVYAAPWHMEAFAAATKNSFGKGKGYYIGTIIKESAFYDALVHDALQEAGVDPVIVPPEGVEVSIRQNDAGKKIIFIMNHTAEDKMVTVPAGRAELLTGLKTGPELRLGRYGVAVIKN